MSHLQLSKDLLYCCLVFQVVKLLLVSIILFSDIYVNLGLVIKQSQLILQITLVQNVNLFVPLIFCHLQLFKPKTSLLGLLASQPAYNIYQNAYYSCQISSLIDISIMYHTTNTPLLLSFKLQLVMFFGQLRAQ